MAEPAQDQLVFLLTLGTIGVLTLTLFIVVFFFIYQKRILILQQQNQKMEIDFQEQMSQSQLEAQEKDRVRIAADLHDSVGSLLWGAKLNASFIDRTMDLTGESRASYVELMKVLDQTIETVRRIAWQLTPEAFHHAGLSKSLEKLCESIDGKGILVVYSGSDGVVWNNPNALQTFRIVQELVSNSVKHSNAKQILVNLTWGEKDVSVSVEDDGIGFELETVDPGVGWWSIRRRAKQISAEISIGKPPINSGSLVSLKIPLANEK